MSDVGQKWTRRRMSQSIKARLLAQSLLTVGAAMGLVVVLVSVALWRLGTTQVTSGALTLVAVTPAEAVAMAGAVGWASLSAVVVR